MTRILLTLLATILPAAAAAAQSGSLYKLAQAETRKAAAADKAAAPAAEAIKVQSLTAPPKADPRTFAKEQLITILVQESTSHTTDGATSTSRESSVDAKIDEFIRFNCGDGSFIRPVSFKKGDPQIIADGDREFDGAGTAERTDNLVARITGKIIDIKPNGNLVLEASKKITTDEDTYTITLTGVCRTEDVTPDNTIISNQIAELDIVKKSTGMVKDATKRGILHRIADFLNIF